MTSLATCNVPKLMNLNFDRFPISDGIVPLISVVSISFEIENHRKSGMVLHENSP